LLKVATTTKFKKDLSKAERKYKNKIERLHKIIEDLMNQIPLDSKFRNHRLVGDYQNCWECHVFPDLLLIYEISELEIKLLRLGSHSELFS
jgi:YafQ family addiction module toxin component